MHWHFRYQIRYRRELVAYEIVVVNVPSGDDAAFRAERALRKKFPGMTIERVIIGEVDQVVYGVPRIDIDFSDVDFATMSNRQIADLKGTSVVRVAKYRREMGIPSPEFRGRPRGELPPTLEKILATGKLGIESDTVIASEFGVTRELIRQYRNEFGIPPVRFGKLPSETRADLEAKLADILASGLLGQISDSEIARRYGLSNYQVARFRRRHQIPTRGAKPSER